MTTATDRQSDLLSWEQMEGISHVLQGNLELLRRKNMAGWELESHLEYVGKMLKEKGSPHSQKMAGILLRDARALIKAILGGKMMALRSEVWAKLSEGFESQEILDLVHKLEEAFDTVQKERGLYFFWTAEALAERAKRKMDELIAAQLQANLQQADGGSSSTKKAANRRKAEAKTARQAR